METFGAVLIAMLVLGGPLIWAMTLNLRDRREARLLGTVLAELDGRDFRGRVAVKVRAGLLWAPSVVKIHLLCASRQEIWEILGRLSERLSRRVRLEVTGPVGQPLAATFTFVPALSGGRM
ncbi:MAG: hypothetical protein HYY64_02815 [Candidatus Rokubacteria bacterium]|nr:hypothetical protein [Candidatus Rokubacteria bacterium]